GGGHELIADAEDLSAPPFAAQSSVPSCVRQTPAPQEVPGGSSLYRRGGVGPWGGVFSAAGGGGGGGGGAASPLPPLLLCCRFAPPRLAGIARWVVVVSAQG